MLSRFLSALALSLMFSALSAAPLCPPSNAVGVDGIGDGCSVPTWKGLPVTEVAFPDIGAFKPTFDAACQRHDKCLTTLGQTASACNSQFLSDMRSACRDLASKANNVGWGLAAVGFYFPGGGSAVDAGCETVALKYYGAVEAYFQLKEPMPGFQANALNRSRQMESQVLSGACETSPEGTTLYTDALINKVNAAFQTYAGRQPTTLEVFRAINAGDIVRNPSVWEANLPNVVRTSSAPTTAPHRPVYRYNRGPWHFYTVDWNELGGGTGGWVYEGGAGYLATQQVIGTKPLHRYWNRNSGDHLYTTNWGELRNGVGDWVYEAILGYCPTSQVAGTQPLYRYYAQSGTNGFHFMTTSWAELGGGTGPWRYEGIACYPYADNAVTPVIRLQPEPPPATALSDGGSSGGNDGGGP